MKSLRNIPVSIRQRLLNRVRSEPLHMVFCDVGFRDDSVKINVEQIFKLMSPHTEVKTI